MICPLQRLASQQRALYEAEKNRQLQGDNEKQGLFLVPFGGSY